jgi:signal transduction histidine kinase
VEEFHVGVISTDPDFFQLIQSSLSIQSHQPDQICFDLIHHHQAELPQLEILKSVQAWIMDEGTSVDQHHALEKWIEEHSEAPLILISATSGIDFSLSEKNTIIAAIPKQDVSDPLFPPLIFSIISQSRLNHNLISIQEELNNRIKELQSIRQASLHITKSLSLQEVLDGILEIALELTGADDSLIYLFEHGNLTEGTVWGFKGDISVIQKGEQSLDNLYVVTKGGNVNLVEEGAVHPIFLYKDFSGSVYDLDLQTSNTIIGGMTIGFRKSHYFSKSEKEIFQMLADQAAIAIENARLFKIANQLAVVDERTRLARELHDSVAQALYGISLFAKASQRKIEESKNNDILSQLAIIQSTALDALQEMRLLLFELRPPQVEHEGLIPALIARLEAVEERSGITVDFSVAGNPTLSDPVQDALYRIAQESLNNSLKHSQANKITIKLASVSSMTEFIICDNGNGFNIKKLNKNSGQGIQSMKERVKQIGGEFWIKSSPGCGTTIKVEVPNG